LDGRVIRTKVEKLFDVESTPSNEMAALEGRSGNENEDDNNNNNNQNEDDEENNQNEDDDENEKQQQQQSPASASPYASNEPSTKQYRATQ
jgi:hypothetical protein